MSEADPPAVTRVNSGGLSPVVLLCEHASNHIPARYARLATPLCDFALSEDVGEAVWTFEPAVGLRTWGPAYQFVVWFHLGVFAAMRRETPDLDARIGAGDLTAVFDWLRERIWSQASRWETDELVRRASGEPLNPAHYRAHLEARYLG